MLCYDVTLSHSTVRLVKLNLQVHHKDVNIKPKHSHVFGIKRKNRMRVSHGWAWYYGLASWGFNANKFDQSQFVLKRY